MPSPHGKYMKKLWESVNNMKRLFSVMVRSTALIISVVLLLPAAVVFAEGENDEIVRPEPEGAPYIYFYNFENDRVLYEKGDGSLSLYPAATVKIMAGICAIEALGDDRLREITVTDDMLSQASGNKIGFQAGEIVTAEEMLYCMLVNSANDAAVILSYIVSGSVDAFVSLMNDKAFELGARSTTYTNPTGMHDDGMRTTLDDTVKIAKYAYGIPYFMEIVGTQKYVMEETNLSSYRNIYNRNCLMSKYYRPDYYYEQAIGMNAGSTSQAGYSVVAVARNAEGTLTYLCVIMGAEALDGDGTDDEKVLCNYKGAVELFDWAMKAYGYREVLSEQTTVCEVPVSLSSTADYVTLVPSKSVTVYLPTDVDISREVSVKSSTEEDVRAPVRRGDVLGQARVMLGDEEIGRVDLIATSDVTRSEFLFALERIREFTSGRFFIATVAAAVILTVIYVLIKAHLRQRRLRSRLPRRPSGRR